MFNTRAAIRRRKADPGLIIPSGEDFNFSDWLLDQGVLSGDVVATLPQGNVIGGTVDDGYAFDVGDISAYDSVVLNIEGEIQGKGGAANGGNGSHGLVSTVVFTLNVPGAIYGGGGGGGNGGIGAVGREEVNTQAAEFINNGTTPKYWCPQQPSGDPICESPVPFNWFHTISLYTAAGDAPNDNESALGYPCGADMFVHENVTNGFKKGISQGNFVPAYGGGGDVVQMFSVIAFDISTGFGTIGLGGKGQGYEGAAETGTAGTSEFRSGKGGDGGAGGAWDLAGIAGEDGLPGLTIKYGDISNPNGGFYYRVTDENGPTTGEEPGVTGGIAGTAVTVLPGTIVNYLGSENGSD